MRSRSSVIIYFLIILLIIAYLVRVILTPFVFAAIVAYVLNPVVSLFEKKLRVGRTLAIIIIYLIIFGAVVYASVWLSGKLISEARLLSFEVKDIGSLGQEAISRLPEWTIAGQSIGFQSLVKALLEGLSTTINHIQDSLFEIFTGALNRILQVLIFLVATFYFLKDGSKFVTMIKERVSNHHRSHVEILIKQMNDALGGYLRGQIILVIIMSAATSVFLTVLGVRFALILGIITGFLELIPFIGPIFAGGLAVVTAYLVGNNRFGLDPTTLGLVVIIGYFVLRQFEDYFIIPQLLGRLTKLHPLVVLFAVLAGGKLAGPVGFVLGVPIAASVRILLEYFWARADH